MEYREIPLKELSNLQATLNEVWEDLSVRVIPEHEMGDIKWDYVRAEIWEDSGRVIFFPASSESKDRIDIASNCITCDELIGIVNELDESELNDEEYDVELKSLVHSIAQQIVSYSSQQGNIQLRCFNQDGQQIRI